MFRVFRFFGDWGGVKCLGLIDFLFYLLGGFGWGLENQEVILFVRLKPMKVMSSGSFPLGLRLKGLARAYLDPRGMQKKRP